MTARFVVFSGLPGVGKTTLSRLLSQHLRATYLRIDTIEDALAGSIEEMGPLGYRIAEAMAVENLSAGMFVVADAVNSVEAARAGWREVARMACVEIVEVEVVCSDPAEHRRRVEARLVGGRLRPTWDDVVRRTYEPWAAEPLRIDTAGRAVDACFADLLAAFPRNEEGPAG